jgi:glucose-inhibited division protein A
LRPASAVEYDFALPTQIDANLYSKIEENWFFVSQINGTSGYKEAARQGIAAGVNVGRKPLSHDMLLLGWRDTYIGELIDDLATKRTFESYRIFPRIAEYRLLLNHGRANVRLPDFAEKFWRIDKAKIQQTSKKLDRINSWRICLRSEKFETQIIEYWLVQTHDRDTIIFPDDCCDEIQSMQDEVIYRISYSDYLERECRAIENLPN